MRAPTILSIVAFVALLASAGGVAHAADPPPPPTIHEVGHIRDGSTTITTLRVKSVSGGEVKGVIETVRGGQEERRGERVELSLPATYVPTVGSRLLRYCVIGSCPEWVGLDRGGFHVIRALDPKDDVAPGLTDDLGNDSLCLRARVLWLDEPSRLGRIEGSFDSRTGQGRVWGKLLKRPRPARMHIGMGLGPWIDEAVSLTIGGEIHLVGGPLERAGDCYQVDLLPAAPLARSPAELRRLLAGGATHEVAIAHGTATIDGRVIALSLSETVDGRIRIRGPRIDAVVAPLYDEEAARVTLDAGHWYLDLDGISPPLPGAGLGSGIAVSLRLKKELRGEVWRPGASDPVGTFVLR